MGVRRATGRSAMWTFSGYVAQYLVTLVFTVITARLLDPHVFGIMGLSVVVIAIGTIVADSGTQAALVHREGDLDVAINTALISVPISGALAAGLGVATAPLLAWFYGEDQVLPVSIVLSGVLVVRGFGLVPDALLQRRLDLKWRKGVVDPLAAFAGGMTSTILALLGAGVWALVAAWYAVTLTTTLGSWALVRYRPRLGMASFRTWRELARYGRSLTGAGVVQLGYAYLDTVTIGRNLGPASVGWYGAATRLAVLPVSGIAHVAGFALFPAFARMRGDLARLRRAYLEAARYLSLIVVPVCVAVAAVAEPLVVTLFGEQWAPSGNVLSIMMAWALAYAVFEVTGELLKGVGRTGFLLQVVVVKFIVFAAYLAVLWIAGWVTLGLVAAGLALSMVASVAVAQVVACRILDLTSGALWRTFRPAAVGGVVMAAALIPLGHVGLSGLAGWRHVAGVATGPLVPLVVMAAVAIAGAGLFVAVVEVAERGAARELGRQARGLLRRGTPSGSVS